MGMSRTVVVILDVDDTMLLSAHSILFPLLTRFCSIVFALACTPLFLIVVIVPVCITAIVVVVVASLLVLFIIIIVVVSLI